jgi:hypothetical protein
MAVGLALHKVDYMEVEAEQPWHIPEAEVEVLGLGRPHHKSVDILVAAFDM